MTGCIGTGFSSSSREATFHSCDFSYAPGLRRAARRPPRFVAIIQLSDRSDAAFTGCLQFQAVHQSAAVCERLGRVTESIEIGIDVGPEQPRPNRTLMICAVAFR